MRCFAAWALWFLGKPDQSLQRIREALTLAREFSEPYGLAHALFFASVLHQLRREERQAQEHAEAALAVSCEHGLCLYQAMATITLGWALSNQGRQEEAIEQMRQGIAALRATATEVLLPHFLGLLAEVLGESGQIDEALRISEEALVVADRNGELYYQAELYRIKGKLLLMQQAGVSLSQPARPGPSQPADLDHSQSAGRRLSRAATHRPTVSGPTPPAAASPPALAASAHAEGCFKQSIKIAQQQKARSWELRAVTSLARLYQSQDKQDEALDLLKQVYETFNEGFDSLDLRAATILLDELT